MGSIDSLFREMRGQTLQAAGSAPRGAAAKIAPRREAGGAPAGKGRAEGRLRDFLARYRDLAGSADGFDATDLAFFFREKAGESGVRYVIANMRRDVGVFRGCLKKYRAREICLMIEFLFCPEQGYIDAARAQPTVLASAWCNRLYADALLWADGRPVPGGAAKRGAAAAGFKEIGEW
jgi:hypothetical protein